jgi:hypothetical protein
MDFAQKKTIAASASRRVVRKPTIQHEMTSRVSCSQARVLRWEGCGCECVACPLARGIQGAMRSTIPYEAGGRSQRPWLFRWRPLVRQRRPCIAASLATGGGSLGDWRAIGGRDMSGSARADGGQMPCAIDLQQPSRGACQRPPPRIGLQKGVPSTLNTLPGGARLLVGKPLLFLQSSALLTTRAPL